tara:strand:+ start:16628 stop:17458 length:831 start_codon:yes stop_codon:yes gene_type:complete
MALKEAFVDNKQREAETKAFTSIKAHGLMTFAESAHQDFMNAQGIEPTRETRNAYLLQFRFILDEFGPLDPDDIEGVIEQERMRATKILHEHGAEYLNATAGINAAPSALYAASMGASIIRRAPDEDLHGALIGKNAMDMISTTERFYEEHGRLFQKSYTSPECKTLHMVHIAEQIEQVLTNADLQMKENGAISNGTAALGLSLIDHIGALALRTNRSALEEKVATQIRAIQEHINNDPVAGSNVLFNFPYHSAPEDPSQDDSPHDFDPDHDPSNG